MVRGDPQRNAQTDAGFPLKYPRWVVPTNNDPRHESLTLNLYHEMQLTGKTLIPSLQPLAVGDNIIMRSVDRLLGVDFRTGKRVWMFPENLFVGQRSQELDESIRDAMAEAHFGQRMFADSLFGQVSSDGQSIFVVQDVGFAGATLSPMVVPKGQFIQNPLGGSRFNSLVAVQLDRQGAVKWYVGGEHEINEPEFKDVFFFGAPLPLDDCLFVLYEKKNEVRLACLESATGHLLWSQHLANVETEGDVIENSTRRLAGWSPSYCDGILICPTSAHAVIAVDLSNRALLWGFEYGAATNPIANLSRESNRSAAPKSNWLDSTITAVGGAVVLAPVESDQLYCLDLLSGQSRWHFNDDIGIKISQYDYLAGVVDNKIVLVGNHSLAAIDVGSGRPSWTVDLGTHGQVSGRGYLSEHSYYLPTTNAEIVQVELIAGKIDRWVETDRVLGNIIPFRGDIISHGVDFVSCYPQADSANRVIANAESAGGLNADQKLLKAQLLAQQNRLPDAVSLADQVVENERSDRAVSVTLDLILDLLRNDYAAGRRWAEKYDHELTRFRQIDYLDARLSATIQQFGSEAAVDLISDWIQSAAALSAGIAADNVNVYRHSDDGSVSLRLDTLYRNRLHELSRKLTDDQKTELAQLARRLANADDDDSLARLQVLAATVSPDQLEPEVRSTLVQRLVAAGQHLAAERLVYPLLQSSDEATAAWATADYAGLLEDAGLIDQATRIVDRLSARFASVPCNPAQKTGSEIAAVFAARHPASSDANDADQPSGIVRCEASHFSRYRYSAAINVVPVFRQHDSPIDNEYVFTYSSNNWALNIADADGKLLASIDIMPPKYSQRVYISGGAAADCWLYGHTLLVEYGNMLTAVDMFRLDQGNAAVLWRQPTATVVSAGRRTTGRSISQRISSTNWGEQRFEFCQDSERIGAVGGIAGDSVCCMIEGQLACLDVATGTRRWIRGDVPPGSSLAASDRHVVVFDGQRENYAIYDSADGSEITNEKLPTNLGRIWWQLDERLLLSNDTPTGKALNCVDMVTRKPLWSREFEKESRAQVLQASRAAVLQPAQGTLEIIDLNDGKTLLTSQLGTLRSVQSIEVHSLQGCYLVEVNLNQFFRSNVSDPSSGASYQSLDYRQQLLHGFLFAFDAGDGHSLWESPAKIEYFDVAQPIPRNSPLIVLDRFQATEGERVLQMAAIDVRSGRLAVPLQSQTTYNRKYQVEYDRQQRTLNVVLGNTQYHLHVTDELPPPAVTTTIINERFLGTQPPFPIPSVGPELPRRDIDSVLQELRQERLELEKKRDEMERRFPSRGNHDPGLGDKPQDKSQHK